MRNAASGSVLLIVDVINDLAFPGGENVLPWARRVAPRLAVFRRRARAAGMAVVYANDNYGHWKSDFADTYRHCTRRGAPGAGVSRALRPMRDDYFILKPKHSAFYASSLDPLLAHLGTRHVVLAGISTNICVAYTAHDAHMRDYRITVLSDCCAAESDADHDAALNHLRRFCGATVCTSDEYQFGPVRRASRR